MVAIKYGGYLSVASFEIYLRPRFGQGAGLSAAEGGTKIIRYAVEMRYGVRKNHYTLAKVYESTKKVRDYVTYRCRRTM
jgi:hypothetical protein